MENDKQAHKNSP